MGTGDKKLPGYLNVDANPEVHPDLVLRIPPLPFGDDSIDEIHASHFLEHVSELVELMDECFRVLKSGGIMSIVVPYALSHTAFQDPYHVRFFVPESFWYFTSRMAYLKYPIKARFEILVNEVYGEEVLVVLRKS